MPALFPIDTRITQVRSTLRLIRENKGKIELAELSNEANEDIDILLPIITACKMLGFITIKDAVVKLTPSGAKVKMLDSSSLLRSRLRQIEPFKGVVDALKGHALTTSDVSKLLRSRGVVFHSDKETNDLLLRDLLLNWAISIKLLKYDIKNDVWKTI